VRPSIRPANDLRCYDDLAGEWWRPDGAFAVLHWLAAARGRLVPPAGRPNAVLVDVGCGAGLLAPHVQGKGYLHVGVDLVTSALEQAAAHGVVPVRGDATALPLPDGCADVVSAGELLEHVYDLPGAVREVCRVLRPGGLLVVDTLNATRMSRLLAVSVGERLPGVPRGIHDPELFVPPWRLVAECGRHGVKLEIRGIRPTVPSLLRWLASRARPGGQAGKGGESGRGARIVPTFSTAVLYQGRGTKTGGAAA
jgi:2-polyprenyl-6-hydroxyphenyl methylase/3-demethylubiquinone-9 3-methyltransferase